MLDIHDIALFFSDARSDEVRQKVEQWASTDENRADFAMLQLISETNLKETDGPEEAASAWESMEVLLDQKETPVLSLFTKILSYAAVALVLLGLFFAIRPNPMYDTLASGSLTLTDGSTVELGPNSTLRYPLNFDLFSERRVQLKGTATFDVAKDDGKKFVVESFGREVKVLGTVLKYESAPLKATLENIEGLIAFYEVGDEASAVILKQGEKAVYIVGQGIMREEPSPISTATPSPRRVEELVTNQVATQASPLVKEPVNEETSSVASSEETETEVELEAESDFEADVEPEAQSDNKEAAAPSEIPMITVNLDAIAELLLKQFPDDVVLEKRLKVKKREVEIRDLSYYSSLREAHKMLQEYVNCRGRQDKDGKFVIEEVSLKK